MAVVNDLHLIASVEVKNQFTVPLKKHGLLRTAKNRNVLKQITRVSKGCHNCSHYLSKYYYWKQSPCDSCSRSPMFYYRFTRLDIPDLWKAKMPSSDRWKNILQS